jgi:hypothetical protein
MTSFMDDPIPVVVCCAHVVVGVGKADGQEPLRCDRDHDVDGGHLGLNENLEWGAFYLLIAIFLLHNI